MLAMLKILFFRCQMLDECLSFQYQFNQAPHENN